MGCVASSHMRRSADNEVDVVSLCREKKSQLNLAVKCRSAFAEAQWKYNHSLLEVAKAISQFVERHSSPPSPVTINASDDSCETVCDVAASSEGSGAKVKEKLNFSRGKEKVVVDDCEEEVKERQYDENDDEEGCEHFYDQIPHDLRGFFDSLSSSYVRVGESSLSVQEKLIMMRKVRELEEVMIPADFEEEEDVPEEKEFMFVGGHQRDGGGDQSHESTPDRETTQQDLIAANASSNKRELLEALKDVEDQFLRVHEANLHLSKLLEVSIDSQESRGNSNKLKQFKTWNQTSSSSSLSSNSTSDSPEYWGGKLIGSHQMTLVRLYEWQKKLYKEVKDGDKAFKLYKRKCIKLLNQSVKEGDHEQKIDKIRAETKQLYSKILVSLRNTEIISERVKKLRDEELHPQLVELLNGLKRTWKIMSESHEIQGQIMHEVGSFMSCSRDRNFSSESHLVASLQLLGAIRRWRGSFEEYVSTEKAYVGAVGGWLNNSPMLPPPPPSTTINGPPLLVLYQNWLALLELLPDKAVARALEGFRKDIKALWIQQGAEKQQKRKVDMLMREWERRERELIINKGIEADLLEDDHEHEPEENHQRVLKCLKTKREMLDKFKERVEIERGKHLSVMEQTKHMALTGFHEGFSSVFESLAGFSNASVNMYSDLIAYMNNASARDQEKSGKPSREAMNSQLQN